MRQNINGEARHWLVFYTRSRCEKISEKQIRDSGITVFLPQCEVIRQWKDRKKKLKMPLFPNYIFACVNERERIQVLECSGIVRNLSFNGRLVVMKPGEIRKIELLQRRPDSIEPARGPLPAIGKPVIIKDGPMMGLRGDIVEHYGETHLLVRIDSIHQAVKVRLSARMVSVNV